MSTFVASTSLAQMIALGAEGERSHGRTTALISRHLSPEHAAILADPVPLRDGSGVDWYVDEDGEVTPLAALPPAEADALRRRLATLLAEIRAKADQIEHEPGNRQAAASALRHATQFPGEDCIYALRNAEGMRPVVVAWGYISHDPDTARPFNVSTLATRPEGAEYGASAAAAQSAARSPVHPDGTGTALPPPSGPGKAAGAPGPAPDATRRPVAWGRAAPAALLGLLALLLFALTVAFLLPACGLRTPFGMLLLGLPSEAAGCTAAPADDASAQADALERELAILRQLLVDRQSACPPPAAPAPPAPPPEPPRPPIRPETRSETPPPTDDVEQRTRNMARGNIEVTLAWDGAADLDLYVECLGSDGNWRMLNYASPNIGGHPTACGGALVSGDLNRSGGRPDARPVEHMVFNLSGPPAIYRTSVALFSRSTDTRPRIPYTFIVKKDGKIIDSGTGSIDERTSPQSLKRYNWPSPG